ncbi:uncharacterized protein LOC112084011 [Eutrema salsugineum]|uniref:uncharacterized protein LOC112084011 n=1 Tax=Eutrema salsugineum TaxID=72664 RepID=UPI000CED02CA|nr:uncharacterized protein LOC112084011 [Eutrema salsugineum]
MQLIKEGSFWAVKDTTTMGSWMWKKLLKYRDMAKTLYRMKIGNGERISFWYDSWSNKGCLIDLLGERGFVDMGISQHMTLAMVMDRPRRRRYRQTQLQGIEEEIVYMRTQRNTHSPDEPEWRRKNGHYQRNFSAKDTGDQIRKARAKVMWHKGVWFSHATPKYSFLTWLAIKNRLTTGDRMMNWSQNVDARCVFCGDQVETRDHLFFTCTYTKVVWRKLTQGLLKDRFTLQWNQVLDQITQTTADRTTLVLLRYSFQTAIHSIWRERNSRRHGGELLPTGSLVKMIDKNVRNQLCSIRMAGSLHYEDGLQIWFSTRTV